MLILRMIKYLVIAVIHCSEQKFKKAIKDGYYKFYFSENGEDALSLLTDEKNIEIVLTDINMPKMDGLTLLENINRLDRIIKVVIVSAFGDFKNIRKAMNMGAFDFITKPFDFTDLEITVEKTINELEKIKLTEILRIEKDAAEESSRAKSRFLANMSHELKTPLSSMLGYCRLLEMQKSGSLNEKQLEYVDIIKDSGNHLLDVINDILDISKIEANRLTINKTEFDLNKMIRRLAASVKPMLDENGITLTFDLDQGIEKIYAEQTRLRQVLTNLLSNAVKFIGTGKKIGFDTSLTGDDEIQIIIWDEGIGIAENDIDIIFNPFEQIAVDKSLKNKGTGLGLAISKGIIEMHAGTLSVSSKVNKGTRFTITMPWENNSNEPEENTGS